MNKPWRVNVNHPHFICIGAQKAGTTWLHEILSQNPSVWMPPIKEIHYFDNLNATAATRQGRIERILRLAEKVKHEERSARRLSNLWTGISRGRGSRGKGKYGFLKSLAGQDILTENWYQRIFSHSDAVGRVSGEITPSYLTIGEEEICYLKALLKDVKLILIIREPTQRALSELRMTIGRSHRMPDCDEQWNRLIERQEQRNIADYGKGIPRWQKYFSSSQLLIVPFGHIKRDPSGLIRQIETFIGASPFSKYQSLNKAVHKTKKIEIPTWVSSHIESIASDQRRYIIDEFGQDFFQNTL